MLSLSGMFPFNVPVNLFLISLEANITIVCWCNVALKKLKWMLLCAIWNSAALCYTEFCSPVALAICWVWRKKKFVKRPMPNLLPVGAS